MKSFKEIFTESVDLDKLKDKVDPAKFYESLACLGIILTKSEAKKIQSYELTQKNPKDYLSFLKDIIKKYKDIYDFNKVGIEYLLKTSYQDESDDKGLLLVTKIISGMIMFGQDNTSFSKKYFISERIHDYYVTEEKIFGKNPESKRNTADAVMMDVPIDKFFNLLESTPKKDFKIDDKNGSISIMKGGKKACTFYQLSLKKGHEEAQLGKIGKFMRKRGITPDIVDNLSSVTEEIEWYMNEGILGNIKNYLSGLFSRVISIIRSRFDSFITKVEKDEIDPRYIQELVDDLELGMNEAKMTVAHAELIKKIKKDPNLLLKALEKKYNLLKTKTKKRKDIVYSKIDTKLKKLIIKSDQDVFKHIASYMSFSVLINLLNMDEKSIYKLIMDIKDEMLFGDTSLPLWKVYGNFGGTPYEYLGIKFKSKGKIPKIEIIGYRINTKNTYNFSIVLLYDINKKEKKYSWIRSGTNSSSRLTYNLEGTGIKKLGIKEELANIL